MVNGMPTALSTMYNPPRVAGPGPLFDIDADGDMVYVGSDDPDELLKSCVTREERQWAQAQIAQSNEVRELHMSPVGALNLPKLLDKRRILAGIPDRFFKFKAEFDRVLIFQIPFWDMHKIGKIALTDDTKALLKQAAPRGILLSAGLGAMDSLYDHGIELGDIVTLQKSTPYRFPVITVAGVPQYMIIMTAGEICASEDSAFREWRGELVAVRGEDGKHFYKRVARDCSAGHKFSYGFCQKCGVNEGVANAAG